jgi:TolA-binding protein
LEPLLNKLIESGARGDAARAQIMRGDVRMAQNQVEAAALDYLRTVVLFESEQASQPEALLKTAQALEKLRDARAKEMYRTLAAKYPSSPQAAEARGKF